MKPSARTMSLFASAMLAPFAVVFLTNSTGSAAGNGAGLAIGAAGAVGADGVDNAAGAAGTAAGPEASESSDDSETNCPDHCDEHLIENLTRCKDLAFSCANDAQKRFDTAKSRLTENADGGDGDTERAADYAAAMLDLSRRNDILKKAEDRLTELTNRYRAARTWGLGLGVQADIAAAAGGKGLVGVGVPLTLRSTPVLELELTPGFASLRGLPQQASGADYQFATLRGNVGWVAKDGTALTLGLGAAVREKLAQDSFILAPIALRHRFNNDLDLDLKPRFITEVSFFVEPWIPIDGGRSMIFFGASVSLGVGGGSLGEPKDLCLSKTAKETLNAKARDANPHEESPCARDH